MAKWIFEYVPVLFKIVLSFEGLSADLTGEGHVVLVTTFMYHEVVGLGKTPLAVLANELNCALGAHLLPAAELPAVPLCLHWHYREHPYNIPTASLRLLDTDSTSPPSIARGISLSFFYFLTNPLLRLYVFQQTSYQFDFYLFFFFNTQSPIYTYKYTSFIIF